MLKNGNFQWQEAGKLAFAKLKEVMMSPILKVPNFEQDFVLECDASEVGAILM